MVLNTLNFLKSHPLNRQQPWKAYWRFLEWQIKSRLQPGKHTIPWIEGAQLRVARGMFGATGNIYCGLHEYADMAFVLHALRKGDVFLDVGANVGSYTVLASAVRGARTIAFEPDPVTVRHLQDNIDVNAIADLVDIEATAVGDRTGTIPFTKDQDTVNQVANDTDENVRQVAVTRLDDVPHARDAVVAKLDVEGFEAHVLRGAHSLLRAGTLIAVETEANDDSVVALLTDAGFERRWYDPRSRSLMSQPIADLRSSNALYIKDERAVLERVQSCPPIIWRGTSL